MVYLRADTAVEVLIGPAVAVGDGFTPVTTLVLTSADEAELIKYNQATTLTGAAITNVLAALTSAVDGYYSLELTTGETNTEGPLWIVIQDDSLILPLRHEFMVVNANVYDSMFAVAGTAQLQVNTTEISGDSVAADRLETMLDGTGGNTLSLGQLNIVASGGNSAIVATGNGVGHGIIATGGATGNGITVVGGGTSGDGVNITCTSGDGIDVSGGSGGHGIITTGQGSGRGLMAMGGTSGGGIQARAGATATTDSGLECIGGNTTFGIRAAGGSTSGDGINAIGTGGGHGIRVTGNAGGHGMNVVAGGTGNGINVIAGSTSGDGINITTTIGDGIQATGAGGGFDINADIEGNLNGTVTTVTTNTDMRGTDNAAVPADLGYPEINQAFPDILFLMVDNTDHVTPETGLTVTGERSINGGAFVAVSGSIVEVSDGIYQFDALAADMNGGTIMFRFSNAAADDTFVFIKTRP